MNVDEGIPLLYQMWNLLLLFSAKPVIQTTLQLLVDWIESISGEVLKSKQICYQSIQELVTITLGVFPIFIHQPGTSPVYTGTSHYYTRSVPYLYTSAR